MLPNLDAPASYAASAFETIRLIHWLASSNYRLEFVNGPLSERLIFPAGPADSHGMEDARFVRFVDDDGTTTYYATYTAYDGFQILPQLIETSDFLAFDITTMSGESARNKGLALFPVKIDGRYAALSRHDRERLYLSFTDDIRSWDSSELIYEPGAGWEVVQVGNCGSPIETDDGWLVITHGVGPMRRYCLGAVLLDRKDPKPGARSFAAAISRAGRGRARRVRSQCRLFLRWPCPRRQPGASFRCRRPQHWHRHRSLRRLDRGNGLGRVGGWRFEVGRTLTSSGPPLYVVLPCSSKSGP